MRCVATASRSPPTCPESVRTLCDHPLATVVYAAARPLPDGVNSHGDAVAVLRTDPTLPVPDVHVLSLDVPLIPPGIQVPQNSYAIGFASLAPHSRGTVRLASPDPAAAPLIDPAFLTDERDLDSMLAGLRLARDIGTAHAMAEWRKEEALPDAAATAAEQHDFLRRATITYNHAAGTCRMGTDPAAVTDLQLRVHGIGGLRVADASVMASIPA
jgi:choline dehydrogenase